MAAARATGSTGTTGAKNALQTAFDIDDVVHKLKSGEMKNIVVMTGAGLSTAAGIPDFRSPNGVFDKIQRERNVKNAVEVFNIDYFRRDPTVYYDRFRTYLEPTQESEKEHQARLRALPPGVSLPAKQRGYYKPTLAHHFLRLLHEKGLLKRVYTQNIDCLEKITGLPDDKLVFAHGSYSSCRCNDCGARVTDLEKYRKQVLRGEIPTCEAANPTGTVGRATPLSRMSTSSSLGVSDQGSGSGTNSLASSKHNSSNNLLFDLGRESSFGADTDASSTSAEAMGAGINKGRKKPGLRKQVSFGAHVIDNAKPLAGE